MPNPAQQNSANAKAQKFQTNVNLLKDLLLYFEEISKINQANKFDPSQINPDLFSFDSTELQNAIDILGSQMKSGNFEFLRNFAV
jgi:hypothetical protein